MVAEAERGNARELERDRLGRVVREIGERGDAARGRHRGRSLQRTGTHRQRCNAHLGRVVAGLKIAVLVFDVDDRLRAEGNACRRVAKAA